MVRKKKNSLFEAIDFKYALLDTYKHIGLNEQEVMVLLMIDHLLEQGNTFINNDLLSLKMALPLSDIDAVMVTLFSRNFVSYETDGKETTTSLEGIRLKVYEEFRRLVEVEEASQYSEAREESLKRLYAFFEEKLTRTLSPLERQSIQNWVAVNYEEETIKNALLDTLRSGKKSFREIERVLKASRIASDLKQEGASAVDDTWDRDIKETTELYRKMWGDDDRS